jgi:hypothetical protein
MSDAMNELSADNATGFFAALFDFSFNSYIAKKFIKLIYVLATVLIGIATLIFLIAALASGSAGTIIAGIIIVPLVGLLYLVWVRIGLEVLAVIFSIAEDTRALRNASEGHDHP